MFYYLFDFLDKRFDFPGAGVFHYISFRAAMALIVSLLISMVLVNASLIYCTRNKWEKQSVT